VKVWDPEQWTLSKTIELNVAKTTTMKDLAQLIFKENQDVPAEQMEICRILSINKFRILDLCEMEVPFLISLVLRNDQRVGCRRTALRQHRWPLLCGQERQKIATQSHQGRATQIWG
jgi:hypothetical protein